MPLVPFYRIGLLIFLLNCTSIAKSQDTTKVSGFRITTTPTQFIFNNFPISFEKIVSKFNFGLTLSHKFGASRGGEIINPGNFVGGYGYNLYPTHNRLYNAFTIELNLKYYLFRNRKFFLETVLFRSYFWFDNKYVKYNNVERNSFDGLRSESQTVYGFKLLVGRTVNAKFNSKHSIVLDYFGGIGLRNNILKSQTSGMVNDVYYDSKSEKSSYLMPIIHVGLKIGYQFLR